MKRSPGRPRLEFFAWRDKLWDLLDVMDKKTLAEKMNVSVSTINYWLTIWRDFEQGISSQSYRGMTEAHKKALRRLWYYHIRKY